MYTTTRSILARDYNRVSTDIAKCKMLLLNPLSVLDHNPRLELESLNCLSVVEIEEQKLRALIDNLNDTRRKTGRLQW